MGLQPSPKDLHARLAVTIRGRRRRTFTGIGVLAGAMALLTGFLLWRIASEPGGAPAPPPANEFVIFFVEDLTVAEQKAALRRHPQVEFVQTGKLPGVTVVRITGNGNMENGLRVLRQDAAVFFVQKSITGMVCH